MRRPKPDVDLLLADLESSDWKVRASATQTLGTTRDLRAVEPLIEALQDRTVTVKQRAAVALGRLKDERAVEPLVALLKNKTSQLHRHTFNAIVKFGSRAVPAVAKALQEAGDDWHYRCSLITVLGEIKAPAAIDPLVSALQDADVSVRYQAACVLGYYHDPQLVEPLLATLSDKEPTVRKAAAYALVQYDDARIVDSLLSLLDYKNPYGPNLEALLGATNALRRMGGVQDRDLHSLLPLLVHESAPVRIAAALSLPWLHDERAVEPLQILMIDQNPQVQRAAQWAVDTLQEILGYGVSFPRNPFMVDWLLK